MDEQTKFCTNCGEKILKKAVMCPHCGATSQFLRSDYYSVKNRIIAGLLAAGVGGLGIHWFYIGKKQYGVIMLTLGILSLFAGMPLYVMGELEIDNDESQGLFISMAAYIILLIPAIIGWINAAKFFTMTDDAFNDLYIKTTEDANKQ